MQITVECASSVKKGKCVRLVAQAVPTSPPSRAAGRRGRTSRRGLWDGPGCPGVDAGKLHEMVIAPDGCPEGEDAACVAGA